MKNVKNKVTVRSFFEISKLDCSEFLSYLPNKKNVILDFGCGNGIFPKNFSNKKIKLVNMYDKNKKLKTHIKKKYKKNSVIKWTPTININYTWWGLASPPPSTKD